MQRSRDLEAFTDQELQRRRLRKGVSGEPPTDQERAEAMRAAQQRLPRPMLPCASEKDSH